MLIPSASNTGTAVVSTLMAMPSAKGLFHRAIAQSGSAFRGATRGSATKAAEELMARLGLKSNQLDELQKMPWRQLREAFEKQPGIQGLANGPVTDGRSLPKQGEPQPYWHGYSVGRWDGDTLVVQSNNFRGALTGMPGDGWLDGKGDPFTEALTLTERFRRVNYGNLQIDITIDDPKAYTKPFTVRVEQVIVSDGWQLTEFICHENQKFIEITGRTIQR